MTARSGDGIDLRFKGISHVHLGDGTQLWASRYKGDNFYIADGGATGSAMHRVPVSTPYNLQTQGTISTTDTAENCDMILWNQDGSKVYILFGGSTDEIQQYSAGTNYELSNITLEGSISVDPSLQEMQWNDDGTRLYMGIWDDTSSIVEEYSVSSAFDITSTLTLEETMGAGDSLRSIEWNDDGSKLFVARDPTLNDPGKIDEYTLDTPFSLAQVTKTNTIDSIEDIEGLAWSSDGERLYQSDPFNGVDVYKADPFSLSNLTLLYSESMSFPNIISNISWDHCPQYPQT